MSTTAVGHCPHCAAVVNLHWPSCLVCHASMSPTTETGGISLTAPVPPLQAGDQVLIEPAAPNPRPVYWERADTSIVGPGRPEFLAKVGEGPRATYWVVAQFQGVPVWINSIMLRSKKAYEQQVTPKPVQWIREPR